MRYVKMTIISVNGIGVSECEWSFEGNYKPDTDTVKKLEDSGMYHSDNKGLIIGLYIIFDLENKGVKREMSKNNNPILIELRTFMRELKIGSIVDEG